MFPLLRTSLHACRLCFRPVTKGVSASALLVALLAHGVLAALLLQWRLPTVTATQPAVQQIIAVKIFNTLPPKSQTPPVKPAAPPLKPALPPLPASQPAALAVKQNKTHARQAITATRQHPHAAARSKPTRSQPPPAKPAASETAAASISATAPRFNTAALLDSYVSQYQARPLTEAELQSVQQSKASRQLAAAAPQKRATVPGRHANVAAVLDDGSQIVRLGADRCVIADAGADLRKDIHSIRGTPCPGRHSDNAMFERIMAGIGKQ